MFFICLPLDNFVSFVYTLVMDISLQKETLWTIRDGTRIVAADADAEVISRQYSDLMRMQNYFDRVSDRDPESVK